MNHATCKVAATLALMIPCVALADDLTGSQRFLCAASHVTRCFGRGECESGPPWQWNMPSFIQVDLVKKTLSTPATSAEQRRSPIAHLTRDNGEIVIQSSENGRALSMVIDEESGLATIAIALDGIIVNVFAACTPSP